MIDTAIIPAAGLGTRMTPYTKEIPKEMLPIIIRKDSVVVEPVLHYIFESLYEAGVRTFYFIVGRGKRVIEDYFTPDWSYVQYLMDHGKHREAEILKTLYEKIEKSNILMINQPEPKGFGDAILRTKELIAKEQFIVHAGDDIIYPGHSHNLLMLINHYLRYNPKIAFLYDVSEHPERYGVIVGDDQGDYIIVKDVIEKPSMPPSNKVVVAVYIFDRDIYDALERTKPSKGEHQLTDAIRYLIKRGEKVHAVRVKGRRLDFGTPDYYLNALRVLLSE